MMKRILCGVLVMLICVLSLLTATGCSRRGKEITADTRSVYDVEVTTAASAGNTVGVVPESAAVKSSYFDDACFVGDSVSLMLSRYAASGALGKAQFFTAGSLSAANALWEVSDESVHPSYQGVKMKVEDCIHACGAKKVYIMLGMNDIGLNGIDQSVANYKTLLDKIIEKNPDVKIIVQSMTPMIESSPIAGDSLNNDLIKQYNEKLKDMCIYSGWAYVDVASVMYEETGNYLKDEYCSDPEAMGLHFSTEGCQQWVAYLKTHTP